MDLSGVKISKYENTFSTLNSEVSLIDELELIRNGFYRLQISNCRSYLKQGDLAGYKVAKKNLPAVTFSGTFNGAHKKDNLKTYSSLIVIDIDNLDTNLDMLKEILMKDEYIISTWISPSGNGLKVLLAVNTESPTHKTAFDMLLIYFKKKYDLDIDKTGSDLCRLCYLSHDVNLKFKNEFSIFEIPIEEITTAPQILSDNSRPAFYVKNDIQLDSSYNKRLFARLLKYLQTRNLSITKSYDDWYRVAMAIANSFNPFLGKRYFLSLSAMDDNYDEYKCLELLDYCYRHKRDGAISFRTIVFMMTKHGFKE